MRVLDLLEMSAISPLDMTFRLVRMTTYGLYFETLRRTPLCSEPLTFGICRVCRFHFSFKDLSQISSYSQ